MPMPMSVPKITEVVKMIAAVLAIEIVRMLECDFSSVAETTNTMGTMPIKIPAKYMLFEF
jgi:hypothetical protein